MLVLQQWLSGFSFRLFVARMLAVVPRWGVLLSVVSGQGYFVALQDVGIRLGAAAASCAPGSSSGGREPVAWVRLQLSRSRHVLVLSEGSASTSSPQS